MKVVLLGASGHLGVALKRRAPDGIELVPAFHSRPVEAGVKFDLAGGDPLPAADVVIGAFPLARLLQSETADGVEARIVDYRARLGGARLIQLSTDAVYSGRAGLRRESDPVDPTTPYGEAQARVDDALLQADSASLIVRTSFIFGWNGQAFDKRLAPFASGRRSADGQSWAGDVFRSPTEVNFLAEGIWRALMRGLSGPINIAGSRLSIHEFFEAALRELGQSEIPPPVLEQNEAVGRDTSMRADRMEAELSLKQGDVWTWYRNSLPRAPTA